MYASIALTMPLTEYISFILHATCHYLTLLVDHWFPLSLTLTYSPVGIASILGVSFQHHRVKVWDKVPQLPSILIIQIARLLDWRARVTLLPVHRYYRIAAHFTIS